MEVFMKSKVFLWFAQIAVLALALSNGALAQAPPPTTLSGTIDDYNPFEKGGYEMHGTWSLKVYGASGVAAFSAAMNMEHSDLWMIDNNTTDTTQRDQHTHHFTMTGARVISDPAYVSQNCPTAQFTIAATTTGFAVVGWAKTTGNGGNPPFAPNGEKSQLRICVTGSGKVTFSNITLMFAPGSNASQHFGTVPINGVVKSINRDRE
jgi:hypothetical protein